VGSSGTARALREILEQNGWSARGITADGLAQLRGQLVKAGHIDALDLPGLSRDRRPVIAGGFAIMAGLFAELGIEQMDVAETAMREGILYDLLGRFHKHDMREATVDEFMRRYHIDTQQAARVKRVALDLLASCGGGSENDARFLDWAARLHEIGLSVSHSGYHRHSGYILENADMPGFSRTEQARLALLGARPARRAGQAAGFCRRRGARQRPPAGVAAAPGRHPQPQPRRTPSARRESGSQATSVFA
jgi:exopolyphosphatase / guanosine-5'-triphosphate,3'-diphosphate pyrophosphatase